MSQSEFSSHELLVKTEDLPACNNYWIAYSGGLDSHVLLHAFHELRNKLSAGIRAVHVNHGLSENSGKWAGHCREICAGLDINIVVHEITGNSPKGVSIESWARDQRYTLIRSTMETGDILFTAQHRDDQAETLLLQLYRGAGPMGLSSMPEIREFGTGWHARPLLEFTREQLLDYAERNGLSWIEDDANMDQGFDRNFIRHTVMPALKERWPNISGVLSRVACHQAETTSLLAELACADLKVSSLPDPFTLSMRNFNNLSILRQKNLIRFWIKHLGMPLPDTRTLHQIMSNVVSSRYDANPCVCWQGIEIRRFRNTLYLGMKRRRPYNYIPEKWDLKFSCKTPLGELRAIPGSGRGISLNAVPDGKLDIRYRKGGEIIQPAGNKHHRSLKNLLQENNVPPWFRDQIPLLYLEDDLVAVAGFWINDSYQAAAEEESWEIIWDGVEKVVIKE